jgi:hypothetical protein
MHLRPAVRRLTVSWIATVVIVATMAVGMAYNARQLIGACWLAVAAISVYALSVLRRLTGVEGGLPRSAHEASAGRRLSRR